jgi:hypothetical protein
MRSGDAGSWNARCRARAEISLHPKNAGIGAIMRLFGGGTIGPLIEAGCDL